MRKIEWIQGEEPRKIQVSFVKTILNWYNISIAGTNHKVNISPEQFKDLLPEVSPRTKYGCGEIWDGEAEFYFGKAARGIAV